MWNFVFFARRQITSACLFVCFFVVVFFSQGSSYRPSGPKMSQEGLQVTNFDQCLHIVMVIGKCTDVFRGILFCLGMGLRRGGYVGGSVLGGICHGGRKIQSKGRRIL